MQTPGNLTHVMRQAWRFIVLPAAHPDPGHLYMRRPQSLRYGAIEQSTSIKTRETNAVPGTLGGLAGSCSRTA